MKQVNFMNEFKSVETIDEAKKIYKKLCKVYHPDKGGDTEQFKILNNEYHRFIDNFSKVHFEDADFEDLNIELEKIIAEILHYEDIVIEIIGSWLWVSGNTKDKKEVLKGLGFKWASKKKMWFFGELKKSRSRGNMPIDDIKGKYGCKTVKKTVNKKIAF